MPESQPLAKIARQDSGSASVAATTSMETFGPPQSSSMPIPSPLSDAEVAVESVVRPSFDTLSDLGELGLS